MPELLKKKLKYVRLTDSYRTLLTFSFAVSGFIPFILFGIIAVALLTAALKNDAGIKNLMLARSFAAEVELFLQYPQYDLREAAALLDNAILPDGGAVDAYLQYTIAQRPFISSIQIINEEGYITHAAPHTEAVVGYNMSRQHFVQETLKKNAIYWSPPFLTVREGRGDVVMSVSIPFKKGIVVAYLDLTFLKTIIERVKLGGPGQVFMTDQQGQVIAHMDDAVILQRTNLRTMEIVRLGMSGKETTVTYDAEGRIMIGSVAVVPLTGWTAVVTQPAEQAFAAATQENYLLWTGTVFALLISVGLATWNSGRILKPLLTLGAETRRIAEGDYGFSPTLEQPYVELRELAGNFAAMLSAVKDREKALIRERDIARTYLETAGALIVALDADGLITLINSSGCEILEYSKAEITGNNFFDAIFDEDAKRYLRDVFSRCV